MKTATTVCVQEYTNGLLIQTAYVGSCKDGATLLPIQRQMLGTDDNAGFARWT